MHKPKLIVVEGLDSSGKDEQIDRLRTRLQDQNIHYTREPGGAPKAVLIRQILLDPEGDPPSQFYLFFAARIEHMKHGVQPALAAHQDVLSNRGAPSTWAFQVRGFQHSDLEPEFWRLYRLVMCCCMPDAYVLFDLRADVALDRARKVPDERKPSSIGSRWNSIRGCGAAFSSSWRRCATNRRYTSSTPTVRVRILQESFTRQYSIFSTASYGRADARPFSCYNIFNAAEDQKTLRGYRASY